MNRSLTWSGLRRAGGAVAPGAEPPGMARGTLAPFLAMVAAGSIVLFARGAGPFVLNTMYAEDGAWTSLIYLQGARASLLQGREDYLVVGNMALLNAAVAINRLIFGADTIAQLPRVLAVVSYAFYAAVAALPVVALRAHMSLLARGLLWALLLLVPVGPSAQEMWGRVVNTGFAFAFVAAVAIVWRESLATRSAARVLALDALILLCCATNPIAIGITGAFLAAKLIATRGRSSQDWMLAAAVLAVGLRDAVGIATTPNPQGGGAHTIEGFMYTGLARPLVYPVLFPWYGSLNHALTVACSTLLGVLAIAGLRRAAHPRAMMFFLFSAGVTIVATAVQRPNLAKILAGYGTSFPDRYFYAQNLFVLTALVWAIDALMRDPARRLRAVGAVAAASLVLVYASHPASLVDVSWRRQRTLRPSFAEQLRQARPLDAGRALMAVDIEPVGWWVLYPSRFTNTQAEERPAPSEPAVSPPSSGGSLTAPPR